MICPNNAEFRETLSLPSPSYYEACYHRCRGVPDREASERGQQWDVLPLRAGCVWPSQHMGVFKNSRRDFRDVAFHKRGWFNQEVKLPQKLRCGLKTQSSHLMVLWLISWITFPCPPGITSLTSVQVWIKETPLSPVTQWSSKVWGAKEPNVNSVFCHSVSQRQQGWLIESSSNLADFNHFLSWQDNRGDCSGGKESQCWPLCSEKPFRLSSRAKGVRTSWDLGKCSRRNRAGEMAQWGECLLHNYGGPTELPSTMKSQAFDS